MREFTKSEKKIAKTILKTGILRRHAEWLHEIRQLIDQPYGDDENEFSRTMKITDKARKFYREAMAMELYYRNSRLYCGLRDLFQAGYLTTADLSQLPSDIKSSLTKP